MILAKVVALLGVAVMSAALFYGFATGDFFGEGRQLATMPWGIVSLVDLYTGFVLFSASGSEPEVMTGPDAAADEDDHHWPAIMPDGRHAVFTITREPANQARAWDLAVLELATSKWRVIRKGGAYPRFVATGHLLVSTDAGVYAAPFDPVACECRDKASELRVVLHWFEMLKQRMAGGYESGSSAPASTRSAPASRRCSTLPGLCLAGPGNTPWPPRLPGGPNPQRRKKRARSGPSTLLARSQVGPPLGANGIRPQGFIVACDLGAAHESPRTWRASGGPGCSAARPEPDYLTARAASSAPRLIASEHKCEK